MPKEKPPKHFAVSQGQTNRFDEARREALDLKVHHFDLFEDIRVIGLKLPQPAKIGNSLFTSASRPQPAWAFAEEDETADKNNASRYQLNGKGNEPLIAPIGKALRHSIVDPETY